MNGYLYCENESWNGSQTMWDSFQTSVFNAENLSFCVTRTLHARVGLNMRAHASWLCVQVDPACADRGLPWLYFSKNRFIFSLEVILFILTFFKLI